jgi:hypothetical protein
MVIGVNDPIDPRDLRSGRLKQDKSLAEFNERRQKQTDVGPKYLINLLWLEESWADVLGQEKETMKDEQMELDLEISLVQSLEIS